MNLNELNDLCENFNTKENNFSFIVKNALDLIENLEKNFEIEFDVNQSIISRWIKTSEIPMSNFQIQIIKSIQKKTKKHLNKQEQ